MSSTFEAKYMPFGLQDASKRTISNSGFKDEATFLKYAAETNGEYCRVRVTVGPAGGNPLHWHKTYTETFEPEQGTLGVELDGKILHLKPGQTATVPIGHVHRFFNPSDSEPITFVGTIRPTDGAIEKLLYLSYGMAADGLANQDGIPKSLYNTLLMMDIGDTILCGPVMWLMHKLGKLVRWHAQWSGEEDRMLRKYYGTPMTDEDRKKLKLQ